MFLVLWPRSNAATGQIANLEWNTGKLPDHLIFNSTKEKEPWFTKLTPHLPRTPVPRSRAAGDHRMLPQHLTRSSRLWADQHSAPAKAQAHAEMPERHYVDDIGVPPSVSGVVPSRAPAMGTTRTHSRVEAAYGCTTRPGLPPTTPLETIVLADTAGPDDLVALPDSGGRTRQLDCAD